MPPHSPGSPSLGRPRALDEAKRREVCALISVGCSLSDAARYIGCTVITIRREALRNEQFSEALQRAHLAAELSPLHDLRAAAKKYWRAAAWLLERTNPQRFAKQHPQSLTPDQVSAFVSRMIDIIGDEVPHAHARQRIKDRLTGFSEELQREAWLAHRDPCPPPRRARKPRRRLASPPNVDVQPPKSNATEEQ